MSRHIILVGLSGSGKSEVGRLVGALLQTSVSDIDTEVERVAGARVADIFHTAGETRFRALEHECVGRALAAPPHVVVPGAGWIVQSGALDAALACNGFLVYLRVTPRTAALRLEDTTDRPLLQGSDAALRLASQLVEREPVYINAHLIIPADDESPGFLAHEVAFAARTVAGWPTSPGPL